MMNEAHAIKREHRRHPQRSTGKLPPARRDSERILFSPAFRRLGAITQVVGADENNVFRNRLTHSLQVARTAHDLAAHLIGAQADVAEGLGGVDPDVVEAAALGHDIGHPPFGHVGEQELNELVTEEGDLDGFEGNAQSFRIVTKLEDISPSQMTGLNLTRATLNAILKYPRLRGPHVSKWGAYSSELPDFRFARDLENPGDERKSAEAELMDWADDITYAVHDLEDFFRAGLIPLHHLSQLVDTEKHAFFDSVFLRVKDPPFRRTELEQAFSDLLASCPLNQKYSGTWDERQRLNYFTSNLYARYFNGIKLRVPSNRHETRVDIDPELKKELFMLKQLIWTYVIESPPLATQQYGQRKILRGLFEIFGEAVEDSKVRMILPKPVREALEQVSSEGKRKEYPRIICDLVAAMTERQAAFLFRRLTGQATGSAFDYVGF